VKTLIGLLGVLAFLSLPAGAIALLILIGKAIARKINGPPPFDPDPPPVLRRSYTNTILVTLVIVGVVSFAAICVVGSMIPVD